jgi:hypothetical protein
MTVLTETRHAGEYIKSEANGDRSRETGTVASGQDLAAGEVVMLSGGELVAHDGLLDTQGDVITPAVGIMFDAVDATGGAVTGAVYTARDSEVVAAALTFPTETTAGGEQAGVTASLATLGIIAR